MLILAVSCVTEMLSAHLLHTTCRVYNFGLYVLNVLKQICLCAVQFWLCGEYIQTNFPSGLHQIRLAACVRIQDMLHKNI